MNVHYLGTNRGEDLLRYAVAHSPQMPAAHELMVIDRSLAAGRITAYAPCATRWVDVVAADAPGAWQYFARIRFAPILSISLKCG